MRAHGRQARPLLPSVRVFVSEKRSGENDRCRGAPKRISLTWRRDSSRVSTFFGKEGSGRFGVCMIHVLTFFTLALSRRTTPFFFIKINRQAREEIYLLHVGVVAPASSTSPSSFLYRQARQQGGKIRTRFLACARMKRVFTFQPPSVAN